jgi:hypothetical protein
MATKRRLQQKVGKMKREQKIAKMAGEKAAKENQIVGRIGTIRA